MRGRACQAEGAAPEGSEGREHWEYPKSWQKTSTAERGHGGGVEQDEAEEIRGGRESLTQDLVAQVGTGILFRVWSKHNVYNNALLKSPFQKSDKLRSQ